MYVKRKVFLGLGNIAGIFSNLKEGFDELGIGADFYSYSKHEFGYETDKIIHYSKSKFVRRFQKIFLLLKLILKYKYFIFDSGGSLLPDYKDIKLLNFFGGKTMVIFTGCDIRMPENVAQFKWNPCKDCTDEYKTYVGCVLLEKPVKITRMEEIFNYRVSAEEASGSLHRKFYSTMFPINLKKFPLSYSTANKKIKIIHAPSNETYKGTQFINRAVNLLKNELNFEYKVISGVTAEELYEEIRSSDLIIDQLLVGYYGMISIESMAMGKPVVCYIREDLWAKIKHECPIYNANPDNIYDVLKSLLKNPIQLTERTVQSRRYIEKYHDAKKIAQQYLEIFEGKR